MNTGNMGAAMVIGGPHGPIGSASVLLQNSIVWNNTGVASDKFQIASGYDDVVVLMHNAIQRLGSLLDAADSSCCQCFYLNAPQEPQPTEPGFVDAANGDYRLASTSEMIGGGENAPMQNYTDQFDLDDDSDADEVAPELDHLVRVQGAVDLGPYEQWDPFTCPADVSGPADVPDGDVGVYDLLAVLAAWGSCSSCTEDFAGCSTQGGDGTVGVADLLAVLTTWGPGCNGDGAPATIWDCYERYGGYPAHIEACIEALNQQGGGS